MSNKAWLKEHHSQIEERHVLATLKADKGNEAKLVSWSVVDFTEKGDNYATVVTSVEVSYTLRGKEGNVTYVVKVCPLRALESMKALHEVFFGKETLFYKEIGPLMNEILVEHDLKPLPIPKFYYNSDEKGRELVFLEDLRPKGFKMFDRTVGMDARHSVMLLEALATFHGASLLLNEKISFKKLSERYPYLSMDWHNFSEDAEQMLLEMFEPCMQTTADLLHSLGGYNEAEKWVLESKGVICQKLAQHLGPDGPFSVICHGDCWNNNVLFRYDEDGNPVEVMLIDLQLSRVASLATDLNYFMMTSLIGEVRKTNEQLFLKAYSQKLNSMMSSAGKRLPFTFDDIVREFRRKHEYGLIFAVLIGYITVAPKEEIPDFHEIKEEDIPKMVEEFKDKTLELIRKNPLLKSQFLATFEYMLEYGVF
ncbi:uncharacterized kinase-like protein D1044.1 [Palaemon carinicauda]|uniref:uncharacterized kinase-like protein D1044.1 n=1 Tax=Palaemon carinicauda TaxID=392227 RepID=UPI0035B6A391